MSKLQIFVHFTCGHDLLIRWCHYELTIHYVLLHLWMMSCFYVMGTVDSIDMLPFKGMHTSVRLMVGAIHQFLVYLPGGAMLCDYVIVF